MLRAMHPLLQPSRRQRITNRAVDVIGVLFWAVLLVALAAGFVLMIVGALFGAGPAV